MTEGTDMHPDQTAPELQAEQAEPTHDPDQLVPVINTEARIRSLAWTAPGEPNIDPVSGLRNHVPRETGIVRFLPGVNFVRWGDLERVDFASKLDGFQGRIKVTDPASIPEYEAVALAGQSSSGRGLRHWLKSEQRPAVKAAITKRLRHPKFNGEASLED